MFNLNGMLSGPHLNLNLGKFHIFTFLSVLSFQIFACWYLFNYMALFLLFHKSKFDSNSVFIDFRQKIHSLNVSACNILI